MTSCGQQLVDLLEERGVETVFGIPGVHTLEVYRGLTTSTIQHIVTRHEQGAGFMADAYARVTGKPGVALVISGPGVTNAATPVAQAFHDSQPLLLISSVVSTDAMGANSGTIHDLPDQQAFMSTITAFSVTIHDPADVAAALDRAWEVFNSGRPRPVHIEIPTDVLAMDAVTQSRPPRQKAPLEPSPLLIRQAAEALSEAQKPFILIGGGATDAGAQVQALAEQLGSPIGSTINAKGTVSDDHPLCLGATLTFEPVASLLRESDVVVAIGTEFTELDHWALAEPLHFEGRLIRVDIDEEQLTRKFTPDIALLGDASVVIDAIMAQLDRRSPVVDAAKIVADTRLRLSIPPEMNELVPVLEALGAALAPDRIVAADSTQLAYVANHLMPVTAGRSWLMPIGFGSLGCGLPMAIGAKIAAPEREVVSIVGDAGLLFSIAELATAVDLGLAIPVVVWNNNGYGEIRDAMEHAKMPNIATEVSANDFVAIAKGFGCQGETANSFSHLTDLVANALKANRPTVIEVPASIVK